MENILEIPVDSVQISNDESRSYGRNYRCKSQDETKWKILSHPGGEGADRHLPMKNLGAPLFFGGIFIVLD